MATLDNPLIARTIDAILRAEGGYVNDPADKGGETNFGITVSIPVASGQCAASADTTAAAGHRIETRAELDPATAAALDAIAGDGDDATSST